MSQKKDKRKPIELLCEEIIAAHKKGLNDRRFLYPSCKNTNTRKVPMASTAKQLEWGTYHQDWGEVDQESLSQDVFHQKALDKLNEQAAAIFTEPSAGTTASAADWKIRSTGRVGVGDLGKELLIKLSEGLKGAETMQLYQTYVIDLKDYAINQYGPILAKNSSAAHDQALAWLVGTANSNGNIEIFDGDIEHYHFVIQEISSCIPNKIKEE